MSDRYWIKDISITRAPGFVTRRFYPVEGLSSQLNVIWGPNGIGKTTLAKCMRSVLWQRDKSGELTVTALVEGDRSNWRLDLSQKNLVQRRLSDNTIAELAGRNDSMESSYWLSLTDLIRAENYKDSFHETLYQELHGGIDLKKATDDAGAINKFSNRRQAEYKAVEDSKKKITEGQKRQHELEQLEKKIAKINKDLREGEYFKGEVTKYEKALEVEQSLKHLEALQQKLGDFHPKIGKVETTSYNSLVELQERLTERENELTSIIKEVEELEIGLKESGISAEQIGEHALLNRVKNRLKELQEAHGALQECAKELAKSHSREAGWRSEHSWLTAELPDGEKLKNAVGQLKQLSQMYEPLKVRFAVSQELVKQLGPIEESTDEQEKLEILRQRVVDTISTTSGETKTRFFKIRALIASVITALSVILALTLAPWYSLGSLLGALVLLISKKDKSSSDLTKLKKALQATNCQEPPTWDLEGLGDLYLEVAKRLVDLSSLKASNRQREVALENLENDRKEQQGWINQWREACLDLGLMGEQTFLEGSQFFHFSQHLLKWSELRNDLSEKEGSYKESQLKYADAFEKLAKVIQKESGSYTDLFSEAESFIGRLENAHQLTRDLESRRREKAKIEADLQERQAKQNRFLEALDFSVDEVLLLKELSEQKSRWNDLNSELRATGNQIAQFETNFPLVVEIAKNQSREALETELEAWREKVESREEQNKELGKFNRDYERLLESSALAQAEREHHFALEELEQLREEQLVGMAVNILAEHLEQQSQQSSNLEVLNRAKGWFERITNRHYSVGINRDGFFARDLIGKNNLTLEQLSDATRLQLLFAVRMGFIEQQELSGNRRFPIFMDELLANSDDERALTIIEAVKEIAKERQVFYFTAQGDEVEKFRVHAKEVFNEIDLEAVQRVQKASATPLIKFKPLEQRVREPLDDYLAYGESLGVAGASLWEEIAQLHLWHAFLSSQELYRHLQRGYSLIGQLDSKQRAIELMEKAQELARQGRTRSITVEDLRYAPVKLNQTAGYWTQLADKATSGNTLVEALEEGTIKRLPTELKEELIDYLKENSFASTEEALTKGDIINHLIHSDQIVAGSDEYKIVERYIEQIISN